MESWGEAAFSSERGDKPLGPNAECVIESEVERAIKTVSSGVTRGSWGEAAVSSERGEEPLGPNAECVT
jgi:hypothetical protein